MAEKLSRIYVGWQSRPWHPELLAEPKAPSNYKDKAKIAEYVQAKKDDALIRAATIPGAGRLSSVTAIDPGGDVIFQSGPTGDSAADFASFLYNRVDGFADEIFPMLNSQVVALGASRFIGLWLFDLFASGVETSVCQGQQLLRSLRVGRVIADPCDALQRVAGLEGAVDVLPVESVLSLFFPEQLVDMKTPLGAALAAKRLAERLGF